MTLTKSRSIQLFKNMFDVPRLHFGMPHLVDLETARTVHPHGAHVPVQLNRTYDAPPWRICTFGGPTVDETKMNPRP